MKWAQIDPKPIEKKKKDKFTAYYRIAYFFPIQDPHTTYIFVRDYVTKAKRFIELGLLEVYVALSVRKYY